MDRRETGRRPDVGWVWVVRWAVAVATVWAGAADADDAARSEFFEARIRPVLEAHCVACHGDREQGGGLRLDWRGGMLEGGVSGPAIEPGDPDGSLLALVIAHDEPGLEMPKKAPKLPDAAVDDIRAWIAAGAFDPRDAPPDPGQSSAEAGWPAVLAGRRSWWSLQPVRRPEVPAPRDASPAGGPVDRFIRARLEGAGLRQAEEADPRSLARRLAIVLTGLPPDEAEVEAFLADATPGAYERLVDRLLASPRFGERFARHWLDVVRFSETHGNEWNYDVPYAWRYRDYIIRAFNQDLPYDAFVREHIAGDLLPKPRWDEDAGHNESAIGTAFYRFGEVNHDSCVEFSAIGYDIVDNQLDTMTKAFQAMTVACARCHDHKFDAVSARDYHALLGVLRSSRSVMRTLDGPEVNRAPLAELAGLKAEIRAELAGIWRREAAAIDRETLASRLAAGDTPPPATSPTAAWLALARVEAGEFPSAWERLATAHRAESAAREAFNRANFRTIADFRGRFEPGWTATGMGLRSGVGRSGDFAVAREGDAAVRAVLPSGLMTFAASETLNGALRSPTLRRTHGKVSFEVIGGGHSLARLVFNNCQFNYTHQQSLHHDDWSWVTINFEEGTDGLHPYAELLTFWDNPKFPDPLGTLGKDVDNQRQPYEVHASDPRTWWGLRRVVAHDGPEPPRASLAHLDRLFDGPSPSGADELAARYARIASGAVAAFAEERADDGDAAWLDWLIDSGLLSNRADASPGLADRVARYREIERSRLRLPRTMPGLADEGEGFAQPMLARGDHTRPGALVPRGYVEALDPDGSTLDPDGSGRLAVALRIADPGNPLTSRVMVNRVWQWVFGQGLVRTPDDFGRLGEAPSHPELLDFLASRFVEEGWSVKRVVRELVLSRTFRSSAAPPAGAREADPDNRLLAHYPARRAEAEVIRDALLAASGALDGRLFGPSVHPYREAEDPEKRLFAGPLDGDGRRSLYIKFQLMEAPRFLSAFNLPGGKVTQGRRDASNVPAQSLAMLNDPFVWEMADRWAALLIADGSASVDDRVDRMYRRALNRPPTVAERERFSAAVFALAGARGEAGGDVLASRGVWRDAAHAVFNFKEFIHIP